MTKKGGEIKEAQNDIRWMFDEVLVLSPPPVISRSPCLYVHFCFLSLYFLCLFPLVYLVTYFFPSLMRRRRPFSSFCFFFDCTRETEERRSLSTLCALTLNGMRRDQDDHEQQGEQHQEGDLDEEWDRVVLLEENQAQRGEREGRRQRERNRIRQGHRLGTRKGTQIGREIGRYIGYAKVRLGIIQDRGERNKDKDKERRNLERLVEEAEGFSQENIKEEDLLQKLEEIRARYKMCKMSDKEGKKEEMKEMKKTLDW